MRFAILIMIVFVVGCTQVQTEATTSDISESMDEGVTMENKTKEAIFAGGCFWCIEASMQIHEGVIEVISGYTGGDVQNPSYKQVSAGETGHVEAVKVIYDPEKISYQQLLNIFWRLIDPTDEGGSFVDRGYQYTSAIFYLDDEQKKLAEESKMKLAQSGKFDKPIVTRIEKAGPFYTAEEYHQDYFKKNPIRYKFYRHNSGRDQFIEETWGDDQVLLYEYEEDTMQEKETVQKTYNRPSDDVIKEMLTELQYEVTQEEGTEPAFNNEYWDNTKEGIYVDIVSGEPLFSSLDKYESGTGWPSFTKPLVPENIVEKKDYALVIPRIEVRSKHGDSHLGHVFKDGPEPTGLRYCMNSAALRFIPKDKLSEEGYEEFLSLFNMTKK